MSEQDEQFAVAMRYHQAGNLETAKKHYQELLRTNKKHFDALANLASIQVKAGELKQASALYRRALHIDQEVPELWFNFANLCQRLKDSLAAESALQKALDLNPVFPQAWFNLGNVLRDQDKLDEAEPPYLKVIALTPKFSRAYTNLGNVYRRQSRFSEALEMHLKAAALDPGNGDIRLNLANTLIDLKRLPEALGALRESLQIDPKNTSAHLRLGRVLLLNGEQQAAVIQWHELLKIDPVHTDAHMNLGTLYFQMKNNDKAVFHLRKAVQSSPERLDCAAQLGFTLTELGQLSEARQIAKRLLSRAPENVQAHMLTGFVACQEARIAEALKAFSKMRQLDPSAGNGVSNACFSSLYADFLKAEEISALHLEMSALVTKSNPALTLEPIKRSAGKRIRLGYLSPDFRSHPVGFFMQPIMENHDHTKFELFGYALHSRLDKTSTKLMAGFDHWHHCADWSDAKLVSRIRKDELDILVDLGGYTANCKMNVLAQRVAPIQATYLGYPCTTGMAEMDYIVADRHLVPGSSEFLYSENVARLDSSYFCFQARKDTLAVAPTPAVTEGHITFGSFNHLPKLSDRCIQLWARVLDATENSRLLLKALALSDAGVCRRVLERFSSAGIDPDRISLASPTKTIQEHLGLYSGIDIALDTLPYNGATTSCEALWMGVPVISLCGQLSHERMGASILHALGHPEWVSSNEQDYVKAAQALAADSAKLDHFRQSLRSEMINSPLCDASGVTRGLEQQYQTMMADIRTSVMIRF